MMLDVFWAWLQRQYSGDTHSRNLFSTQHLNCIVMWLAKQITSKNLVYHPIRGHTQLTHVWQWLRRCKNDSFDSGAVIVSHITQLVSWWPGLVEPKTTKARNWAFRSTFHVSVGHFTTPTKSPKNMIFFCLYCLIMFYSGLLYKWHYETQE